MKTNLIDRAVGRAGATVRHEVLRALREVVAARKGADVSLVGRIKARATGMAGFLRRFPGDMEVEACA